MIIKIIINTESDSVKITLKNKDDCFST